MEKNKTLHERIQDADKILQILSSPIKDLERCEHCKHWDWTHNCWGDCNNSKIARSQQWYEDKTIVYIDSEKDIHISTIQFFGCTLFEKKDKNEKEKK